jgi:hypothetical protein
MAATSGDFSVAYIQHGVSPKNATYEYMIHILPSEDERAEVLNKGLPYLVKSRDTIAHVVQDNATGIVGYACFRKYIPTNDLLINSIDEESLVMVDKKHADTILMSIADPNLNIEDKSYTTSEPSRPIIKKLTLNGGYVLLQDDDRVKYTATAQRTELEIEVVLGLPVEFSLVKGTGTNITSVSKKREQLPVLLYPNPTNDVVNLLFTEDILGKASVKVYSQYGTLVKTLPSQETMSVMSIDISNLPTGVYYIQIVVDGKSIVKPIVKL